MQIACRNSTDWYRLPSINIDFQLPMLLINIDGSDGNAIIKWVINVHKLSRKVTITFARLSNLTLILPRSRKGNGMVLHFYQQQESSTTKTVHKVINKGLKAYV